MNRFRIAALIAPIALLAACVSAGTPIPQDKVAGFQEGVTTEKEVLAALGAPNAVTALPDGTKIDVYAHTAAHAKAATFVPVVGAFAGGAKGSSETVTFTFGPDGVLKSKTTSTARVDSTMGK